MGHNLFDSAATALLFAAVFVWGERLLFRGSIRDRHIVTSFCAGMSSAYIFVHVMPELTGLREAFSEAASGPLPYKGASIYFVALVGFLAFYGLDSLRVRLFKRDAPGSDHHRAFNITLAGFAVYVWLVSYLLVRGLGHSVEEQALYAAALAVHFLAVGNTLTEEYGDLYLKRGRYLLGAMSIAGWGAAVFVALHEQVLAVLMAFVCGAVIMNTAIAELPEERDGRFLPFMSGGLLYGAILVVLA